MGCSRLGAMAVACSIIAGLLSLSSLLLPYWSEITIFNHGSDGELSANLEVVFGIWGTCVMIQNRSVSDSFSTLLTPSNETQLKALEATLTCASFYQEGVVGIHCETLHGFSDGKCSRSDRISTSSLCAADEPVDMLLVAWDEDQARGTVHTSPYERQQVTDWLRHFLPDMCGTPGLAIATLSGITFVFSVLTILLLLFGVSFDTFESRIVHSGAMTSLIVSSLQFALVGVWKFLTHILHHEGNYFGTAFYLSLASICGYLMTYLFAMRHLRNERDTLIGLGLLEDDDESLDDIFKTKKLADDWNDDDSESSPHKENMTRNVEYAV
ncbi:uncharacterized protein PHALS_00253 [Plasmopara halstedii]|uniref:Transmembrane protein n=1 Tax=Plasmopara halstedii TaxID=4781 RepID=A0A0P1A7F7_PLAHL|nr:uncharacterized protein PHALS_00253 [Plasmopara halstedii]CEG35928.1 hypothetical protein PHALS_00253 [Plasmopara halstedii]|eukprot:XP_024572297.1 hypothetical protein PHALS_00253 [Plasmopara halstedii]